MTRGEGAGRARVGCSGWMYRDWRGLVYPDGLPTRSWLARYAEEFDTVELNTTFYRLPKEGSVLAWAGAVPDGFTFAVKVGQFGTHRKKLTDPGSWLPVHLDRARLLGPHLGPNLVQLPPHWRRNERRLDELLDAAPRDVRWAVEVRDPTWLHDSVYAVLAAHDAALCIHDLIDGHPWERTASWAYLRFHGPHAVEAPYQGRYTGQRLWRAADRAGGWLDAGDDVYAYFNNDWGANAWHDARWFRDRLGSRPGQRSRSAGSSSSSAHRQ